ncbi:helix-turn-helix transcriptional regulator [Pseudorhodoferax sp.]|uniref:helix-turn-helix transcriptional regulator n=1 Tax=Pseudorhodoferax sp. TaxID=1993553 RepID=UPI002DD67368|nr:LuxR C-terminal-related transcriptional regulator [Pseudorhodoferax sp.]
MFFDIDTLVPVAPSAPAAATPYRGPERRSAAAQNARWLALMLDEIDYGMVLLDGRVQVLHINHAARAELDGDHPLCLQGRELRAARLQDQLMLQDALQAAARGLRRLVTLGERESRVTVAAVPLALPAASMAQATLLLLGKRRVCERLSVQWFARSHALTPAESRVLEALCQGLEPRDVAEQHGVALATVRSQIGSIRSKTGADSIRDLVRRVAVLPPMVSSLRN